MKALSPECRAFLLKEPRTGKVATVQADGRPHVAPVWFDLDGDNIIFTTWHTTVKAVNMRRDGRVCFCVDDETPPHAYVQIEGTAVMMAYEAISNSLSHLWYSFPTLAGKPGRCML